MIGLVFLCFSEFFRDLIYMTKCCSCMMTNRKGSEKCSLYLIIKTHSRLFIFHHQCYEDIQSVLFANDFVMSSLCKKLVTRFYHIFQHNPHCWVTTSASMRLWHHITVLMVVSGRMLDQDSGKYSCYRKGGSCGVQCCQRFIFEKIQILNVVMISS